MKTWVITSILNVSIMLVLSCNNDAIKNSDSNRDLLTDKEVMNFIMEYDKVFAERDTMAMKQMIDDNYTYFSSTGQLSNKDNTIEMFEPSNEYKVDTVARMEINYQLNGNVAIVSSNWIGRGSFAGEKFDDNQLCGMVIQKKDGQLKIIAEHCVQIVK